MTIRVLIADDQPLMRAALRTCLDAEPGIVVVGEAADGMGAVRMTQRLHPDLVVMDVRMPIMDGIEATRRVVSQDGARPTRVLVMTTFDLDEHIIDALRAGASGFLVKDAPPEDLIRAVRIIAAGEAVLAPSVTRRLLELRAGTLTPMPSAARDTAVAGLTARERTVLRLVARGLPNVEIARAMDVAPSSVKTHVGHLFAKLGLTDRVQLVVFAYEHELVRPGSPEPEKDGDQPPYLLPAPRTRTW